MGNFISTAKYSNTVMHAATFAALVLVLSSCVNENQTGALTSTEIQGKLSSHEQRHVASKCNSANRLQFSNGASEVLNEKFSTFEAASAGMNAARKEAVSAKLQSYATQLQSLDQELNAQCVSFSACEYQASTTKQSCSTQEHKFLDVRKQVMSLTNQISKIQIN